MHVGLTVEGRPYPVDPPHLRELARRLRAMSLQTFGPAVTAAVRLEQLADHGEGDTGPLATTPMTDEELVEISAAIRAWSEEDGLHRLPAQVVELRHALVDLLGR